MGEDSGRVSVVVPNLNGESDEDLAASITTMLMVCELRVRAERCVAQEHVIVDVQYETLGNVLGKNLLLFKKFFTILEVRLGWVLEGLFRCCLISESVFGPDRQYTCREFAEFRGECSEYN